jgi:phosphotriesterase-related protein
VSKGEMVSVLGPVAGGQLGLILPHEHVLCDLTPLALRDPAIPETEIALANRHAVEYRPLAYKGNHRLDLRDMARAEIAAFAACGGGTVVDLTTGGIAPDPEGLAEIARATGVHLILGAGFYTADFVDAETRGMPIEWLEDTILAQLSEGAWGTKIRCGLIGEIGCSWPLADFERRALQAAARAQRRTGVAINVHPGRHPQAPHEILEVLERAGADPSCVAISHVDRTYFDYPSILALAKRGCWIEFDFFGIETSNYWFGTADLPTDWMRLRYVRQAMADGFADRILLSHDICTRTRLAAYGGHGYAHLIANVAGLMRERGFTETEISGLMRDNPRRFLTGE